MVAPKCKSLLELGWTVTPLMLSPFLTPVNKQWNTQQCWDLTQMVNYADSLPDLSDLACCHWDTCYWLLFCFLQAWPTTWCFTVLLLQLQLRSCGQPGVGAQAHQVWGVHKFTSTRALGMCFCSTMVLHRPSLEAMFVNHALVLWPLLLHFHWHSLASV